MDTFKSTLPDSKEVERDEHGCYRCTTTQKVTKDQAFVVRVFDGDLSQTKQEAFTQHCRRERSREKQVAERGVLERTGTVVKKRVRDRSA